MGKGSTAKSARRKARKIKSQMTVRKKREFTYKGYSLAELQKMPMEELMEILPARARRSLKRGMSDDQKKLYKKAKEGKEPLRTHRRDTIILPDLVGKKVYVHNGQGFIEVAVQAEMIGHYLGEFAPTRKFTKHTGPGVGATRSSKFLPLK